MPVKTPADRPREKTKRPRHVRADDQASAESATDAASPCASLTALPIEILAEILLLTRSPPTVLAVSHTCSFLYRTLALNPAASFIWRGVRESCAPHALPDPSKLWKGSEADYAAFVFGRGPCEICKKTTRNMYTSFAIRLRLCGNWHCQRAVVGGSYLANAIDQFPGQLRESVWVPYVESELCFHPFRFRTLSPTWPYHDSILLRKADLAQFQHDLGTIREVEEARAERKRTGAPISLSEEDEHRERIMQRCNAAAQGFPAIMELSKELIFWRADYDIVYRDIKQSNRAWTRDLARREGWDSKDLVASRLYGSLLNRKNFLLEKIEGKDVLLIQSEIESELLAMRARHKRQEAETTYKSRLIQVNMMYESMRCGTLAGLEKGTSGTTEPTILPPLSVFLTLPTVRALKGSPDPCAIPPQTISGANEIKSSPVALSLVTSDTHNWLVPVKKHLMSLLGYPNGWQSVSLRVLHPLERLTARFYCKKCGEGKVGRRYQREGCLDLKGVCSHVCMATRAKSIEGPSKEAQREGEAEDTDADDEDRQEKSKGKGRKKRGVKVPDWKVEQFEKDEKAIRLVKTYLKLKDLSEESPAGLLLKKDTDQLIRCMSCEGWIVMDLETAVGHAHRHESMEFQLMPMFFYAPRSVMVSGKNQDGTTGFRDIDRGELAFGRGRVESLLKPSRSAKKFCNKLDYGCRHCVLVEEPTWEEGPAIRICADKSAREKGARVMTFHGLRSHVKEKHGIQVIRDEDFFGYGAAAGGIEVRKGGDVWFREA